MLIIINSPSFIKITKPSAAYLPPVDVRLLRGAGVPPIVTLELTLPPALIPPPAATRFLEARPSSTVRTLIA
ncbi:hypothetical protein EON65_20875 [archaeon]|nr:MAG: hypothetical protein EON65_20875 [archaeon]